MELHHTFSVPTSVPETWEHFNDIASVAECFPGAQVASVDGDTFTGSVKVKLGPIALQYNGSGTFVEKDDDAHRFVVEAKGKDKRGNGTAGATVTLSMAETDGGGTSVDVATELNITGKPAQFGRGVMQDVSDKLLGQFVSCLEQRLTKPSEEETPVQPEAEAAAPAASSAETGAGGAAAATAAAPPAAGAAATPAGSSSQDEALDLGSTVLPVLARLYWKQLAGAAVGLLVVWGIVRRLRR